MPLDILTAGVGFVSFGIFLVIQVIVFRFLRPERLLKSLHACALTIAMLPLILMGALFGLNVVNASPLEWGMAAFLSVVLTGLLSFIYVTCVFGPYETSVRTRLIREIGAGGKQGITHQELLERYNVRSIINIRLRRLTGSGDIIEQSGLYRARSSQNIFFLFDVIAGVIKKWIG